MEVSNMKGVIKMTKKVNDKKAMNVSMNRKNKTTIIYKFKKENIMYASLVEEQELASMC